MTETAPPPTEAGETPPAGMPLPLDVLPANFRKHVDPAAPVPLRMMGAKGLVPMGPKDMSTALFMLTFDADEKVREAAGKSAAGLPDKILAVALRDESMDGRVLDYFARTLHDQEQYIEMIVLNQGTPDEAIARVAAVATERISEIIAQNQLRMLRHAPIVRALAANKAVRPSTLDGVTDFCVRSGLVLEDLEAFRDARRRVHGADTDEEAAQKAAAAEIEEAQAEHELEQLGASSPDVGDGAAEVDNEGRRVSIAMQIGRLSI